MNNTFYQAFYPEGIYVIPEKETKKIEVEIESEVGEVEKIKFIGENKKKILILIEEEGSESISERDKEFLGKILIAMKLTYNDVALVNYTSYPTATFPEFENSISFTKMILFGDGLKQIFVDKKIAKYHLTEEDNVEVLYCDSLLEIQEDKMKKVKLWEELKKMIF